MTILTADRFTGIASGGLGHPGSTLAHSMACFGGKLYVGTSSPSTRGPEDRARIERYDPVAQTWQTVFESPVLALDAKVQARAAGLGSSSGGGKRRPSETLATMGREFGLRSMTVFQGTGDAAPCLYVGTMSLWGGRVLRSADGVQFDPVTAPGIDDDTVMSFRGLTSFKGKLFAAPAGTITEQMIDRNLAPRAIVHVAQDPASGVWEPACLPGFGDPINHGVFSLATAHGHLYAGTGSPTRGFQLWRTAAEGPAPYHWERMLTDGAWRFNHNLTTAAMVEFGGDLYVGSGIPGFGYDAENDVGPSAAELIRLHPDGSWDLIFGEPRFTPDGLKIPLSAMGPGLDDPYNAVIWNMCVHQGTLYIGTHNWEPNDWAMHGNGAPIQGGYQLWASSDGENWTLVLADGNGSITSTGVRTLLSAPEGLYLGTSNHTRLLQIQAGLRSGITDIGALSSGFDVLLGR